MAIAAPTTPLAASKKQVVHFPGGNPDFVAARNRCGRACAAYNSILPDAPEGIRAVAWLAIVKPDCSSGLSVEGAPPTPPSEAEASRSLIDFAHPPPIPHIKTPVQIDYGLRLHIPPTSFINYGCIILDTPVADVRIGEHCLIGPNCTIISVSHPVHPAQRAYSELSSTGAPVTIGDHVWFGANVTVLPGVTIGDGCAIGAGAVVTKDIPPFSVAVGNPARVIRSISENQEWPQNLTSVGTLQDALALQ